MSGVKHLYVPALRMKAGELQGIRDLAFDIADGTLPRMIVPPPGERDECLQAKLFEGEEFPDIGEPLRLHWPERDVLVESTYLIDEFGRDKMSLWLPKMFERARASRVRAIPLVRLRDLLAEANVYASTIDHAANLQFGLVISSGDIVDHESVARAVTCLGRIGLGAE